MHLPECVDNHVDVSVDNHVDVESPRAKNPRRYLTSAQVLERYGGRSQMWLWRRLKYDPRFPKPLKISGRQYFDEEALDRFDHACARM
jgi:predicted DNA-binding transcriptional regulator AlpA